ncbi:hypothetical protein G7048_08700 [Diaphorobacter sp. HDW4B]|uniref:RDD family protein n=1 Tax=Diaphorobacter sp. HDW4B TaxID=2714925 RepID=UPI00140923C0|nr:RDD family protein [Diaphorobacter sp. HDW4B]QIL70425.1 hypothetical protein G7048_08700 [Diaphorobacter sp. HDW4B]
MQCPQCNWQNPTSFTECFNCRRPLRVAAPAAATADTQKAPRTAAFNAPAKDIPAEAGRTARIVATIVDGLLLVLVAALLIGGGLWLSQNGGENGARGSFALLLLLAAFVLPFVLLGWLDSLGGTPGKRLLGLQVRNAAGHMPGVVSSTLRQLLKYVTNLGLPFVFHLADRFLFGNDGAHNVITGSYVVRRSADAVKINRHIQSHEVRRAGMRRFGGMLVLSVVSVLLTLIVIAMVYGEIRDARHPQAAEARKAMSEIARSVKPITQLATAHYTRTGRFANDMQELGINALPDGIAALQFDPRNGAITATLSTAAGEARAQGKHLAWLPVFKQRSGTSELKKWRCGSPDIAKDELPSLCNDDMSALAAPTS